MVFSDIIRNPDNIHDPLNFMLGGLEISTFYQEEKMNKVRFTVSILFLAFFSSTALSQGVEINQPAPPIQVNNWVENPDYSLHELENKPVILKFWFTKCGPCVYSIPHMNDLAEKFQSEDVAFVSVSFEKPEIIRSFLREKEFKAMAGSDTSQTTISAYEVRGYPMVFLIDKEGILRWKGNPMSLNESMVSQFLDLSGKESGIKQIERETNKINELGFQNPSFSLEIDENTTQMGVASGRHATAKELTIANYNLKKTLSYLLNKSEYRIKVPDSAKTKYDIRFQVEQGLDSLSNLEERLASVISNRLNYRLATETRNEITYQLKIANDSLFTSNFIDKESSYTGTSSRKDSWQGQGLSKNDVINALENSYNLYFSDGIGLNEKYMMEIPTNNFDKLKERLLNYYGIQLMKTEDEVEVYTLIPE